MFQNPERFFVGGSGAAEGFFYIVSCFWLQMSVHLFVSFHAIRTQHEYWKLFWSTVAPTQIFSISMEQVSELTSVRANLSHKNIFQKISIR